MTHDEVIRGPLNPYAGMPEVGEFELTSNDIQAGEPLPREQFNASQGGADLSPHLKWSGAPAGTKSYAVTCYDPDAPTGAGFWHWCIANIPVQVTELAMGVGSDGRAALPDGAIVMPNEYRAHEYTGAEPPEGTGVHHYWFVVHALDVPRIDVPSEATPSVHGFLMRQNVLARAVLVATGEYHETS